MHVHTQYSMFIAFSSFIPLFVSHHSFCTLFFSPSFPLSLIFSPHPFSFCTLSLSLSLSPPLSSSPPVSTITVFCHLFNHCKRIQVLNLKCCSLIDDAAVITLIQNSSYLASLCLSGCYMVSDRSVKAVANTCKYMQALDLSRTKVSLLFFAFQRVLL